MLRDVILLAAISGGTFATVYLLVARGWWWMRAHVVGLERRLDQTLNRQLLLEVSPRVAMAAAAVATVGFGLALWWLLGSPLLILLGVALGAIAVQAVLTHLEHKRRKHLDRQVVDGITTMASGVRAGLNLVQSMQLLVRHASGPIRQEFSQLLKEYELGIDLNRAMRNASERIASTYYRLLFTAIEAHRQRGGDMGQSLDRIADSIREIQRLEGRLEALTAQGRSQARFMAVLPLVILFILAGIFPHETHQLITEPIGRLILLTAGLLIAVGLVWIRRIMQVEM